jgi:hypothetical protein
MSTPNRRGRSLFTVRGGRSLRAVIAAASLVVLGAAAAGAQEDYSHLPLAHHSFEPAIISTQIQFALQKEQRAYEALAAATADKTTIDPISVTVKEGYVYLRFAENGLRHSTYKANQQYNPLLKLHADMIAKIRDQLLVCMQELSHASTGNAESLTTAHQRLKEIIIRIETLIAMRF